MADTALIGLDWGTTSLRAYRFDRTGQVVEARQRATGIMRIAADGDAGAGFARAFDEACGDWWSAAPASAVVACGMVGSAQGWRDAGYLEVPVSIGDLGRALAEVPTRSGVLHIVPGVLARGPLPEVMRGEETQVAGVLDLAGLAGPAGPVGPDAPEHPGAGRWIALPGTHSKWVRVRDRRIVGLHTFMTGELFAALREHTILGRTMTQPAAPDLAAFDRGVAVARAPEGRTGLLSTLFSARTLGLLGELAADAQADYLSGLLVGYELLGAERLASGLDAIVLAGSDDLCRRYRRALVSLGHPPPAIASGATERGLWRIAVASGLMG